MKLDIVSSDVVATIFLVAFIPVCFAGRKILKWSLFVSGLVGAGYGTQLLLLKLNVYVSLTANIIIIVGAAIAGGVIVVCLAKCAKFVLGFFVGAIFANLLYSIASDHCACGALHIRIITILISGFGLAVLCALVEKYVLEALTAFVGSFMGISGVDHFVSNSGKQDPHFEVETFFTDDTNFDSCKECYIYYAMWGLFFIAGFLIQLKLENSNDESKHSKKSKRSRQSQTKRRRGEPVAFVPVPALTDKSANSIEMIRLGIDPHKNIPPSDRNISATSINFDDNLFINENSKNSTHDSCNSSEHGCARSDTLDSSIGPAEYTWSQETNDAISASDRYFAETSTSASMRKTWEEDPAAFAYVYNTHSTVRSSSRGDAYTV